MPINETEKQTQLRHFILADHGLEAETLARELGPAAGPVLLDLSTHASADVRMSVLESAAVAQGPDICRTILRLMEDPDPEINDLAQSLVSRCAEPELVPEMLVIIKRSTNPPSQAALALKIGELGTRKEIPELRDLYLDAENPSVKHNLSIAMARLGDPDAKTDAIERLAAPHAHERIEALNDLEYIGDKAAVIHFLPLLRDHRAVIALSPMSMYGATDGACARVCDVAVRTMLRLGVTLSFHFDRLMQLEQEHLQEAIEYVNQSIPANAGQ